MLCRKLFWINLKPQNVFKGRILKKLKKKKALLLFSKVCKNKIYLYKSFYFKIFSKLYWNHLFALSIYQDGLNKICSNFVKVYNELTA